MYNLEMPVPPGFIVNAEVYKDFIERTNIKGKIIEILSGLNVENNEELQNKANEENRPPLCRSIFVSYISKCSPDGKKGVA